MHSTHDDTLDREDMQFIVTYIIDLCVLEGLLSRRSLLMLVVACSRVVGVLVCSC
jgi:hypothetical protein